MQGIYGVQSSSSHGRVEAWGDTDYQGYPNRQSDNIRRDQGIDIDPAYIDLRNYKRN